MYISLSLLSYPLRSLVKYGILLHNLNHLKCIKGGGVRWHFNGKVISKEKLHDFNIKLFSINFVLHVNTFVKLKTYSFNLQKRIFCLSSLGNWISNYQLSSVMSLLIPPSVLLSISATIYISGRGLGHFKPFVNLTGGYK